MGTLFDQSKREYERINHTVLILTIDFIKQISADTGLSIDQVTSIWKTSEYERRTDFMLNNGDRWDEQIAGIGEILHEISNSLQPKDTI